MPVQSQKKPPGISKHVPPWEQGRFLQRMSSVQILGWSPSQTKPSSTRQSELSSHHLPLGCRHRSLHRNRHIRPHKRMVVHAAIVTTWVAHIRWVLEGSAESVASTGALASVGSGSGVGSSSPPQALTEKTRAPSIKILNICESDNIFMAPVLPSDLTLRPLAPRHNPLGLHRRHNQKLSWSAALLRCL